MPDVKFSNQYPYTDFHELNLDWVIKEVKYWSTKVGKTIQSIALTGTVGLVDTYTITYSDGTTSTFDVTNGNGIVSIAKTGTAGNIDTYTITYSNGTTSTFDVTNGNVSAVDGMTGDVRLPFVYQETQLPAGSHFEDGYYNSSNVWISSTTIRTLFIPLTSSWFFVCREVDAAAFTGLGNGLWMRYKSDNGVENPSLTSRAGYAMTAFRANKSVLATLTSSDFSGINVNVIFTFLAGHENDFIVAVDSDELQPGNGNIDPYMINGFHPLPTKELYISDEMFISRCYIRNADDTSRSFSSPYGTYGPYYVKSGDIIRVNVPLLSFFGFQASNHGATITYIETSPFTFTADGPIFIYCRGEAYNGTDVISIERAADHGIIPDYALESTMPYAEKDGVAFGTSLTYRSQLTQGYLTFLPTLTGMTIDNQGVGSSQIYGGSPNSILNMIRNYGSYSGKSVVLIEGFVNDWYNSAPLGDITDTAETSVCGCLNTAITWLLTNYADIQIFVILDHYGRNSGGVDCSEQAVRNSLTQYEFYQKLADLCKYRGIKTVKQYADSGMNGLTPQYFADNIHPTMLGAEQSANVINDVIRTTTPKAV